MPFVKGVSGNPGGISKELVRARERARGHIMRLIDECVKIACDPDVKPEVRLNAAQIVMDRGGLVPAKAEAPEVPAPAEQMSPLKLMSTEELLAERERLEKLREQGESK